MRDQTGVRDLVADAGRRVAEAIGTDPLATVELLTDEDGVTHVYVDEGVDDDSEGVSERVADGDGDDGGAGDEPGPGPALYALAYANGYVQARDRLFQMDVLRHVGYGDSAALLGPRQLRSDVQVRRDLYDEAELEAQFEAASERARTALRGFANGVNRQLVEMVTAGSLPAEFVALGHVPEPWTPVDSVAVAAYMLGAFGVFGGNELDNAERFARLRDSLGDGAAAFEAYGDLNRTTVPDEHYATVPEADLTAADLPVDAETVPEFADVPDAQLELAAAAADAEPWGIKRDVTLPWDALGRVGERRAPSGVLAGLRWGSNALAVGGDLTETGRPMLFGGPQMGYFKPPVVHEIGLHGAGFDVAGVGVVGTPGVLVGRTPEFAWTVTSGYDDGVDTVAVELHPEDRHRYRVGPGGEWREMDTETVTHRTSLLGALADDEERTVVRVVEQEVARIRLDGDDLPVVAWNEDERVAWARRTATRGDELDGAFAWAELGRREGREAFVDAVADIPFSFNFVYADAEDVAYVHTGRVPERNPDLDPRLPAPAAAHEWRAVTDLGFAVTNPSRGYVAQWNNAPVAGYRAGDREGRWGRRHRVDLLDGIVREKLGLADGEGPAEADRTLSLADVEAVVEEAATHDPIAGATTPLVAEVAAESEDKRLRWMAAELEAWADAGYPWRDEQRVGVYDDPGHASWDATRRELQTLVFRDRLGDLTPELQFDPPKHVDLDADEDPHAGDHGRAVREVALVRVLRGDADGDWLGGATPEDVVAAALERAADRLEERFGTSDPTAWRLPVHRSEFVALGAGVEDAIAMVNRGSYNFVVALGAEAGDARSILPPGNSGHVPVPLLVGTVRGNEPAHLTDQLERYEDFAYKPLPVARAAVEARTTAEKRLWLRPGRPGGLGSGLRDTLLGVGLSLAADV